MRKRFVITISSILTAGLVGVIYFNGQEKNAKPTYSEKEQNAIGAAEYIFEKRKNPETGKLTFLDYQIAADQAAELRKKVPTVRNENILWKELGPDNVGGRVRALLVDDQNPNRIYAGGVSGGLWYSDGYGSSWRPTVKNDERENLAISSLTQDENGYVYYGTGEGFYYISGQGTGGIQGGGMYRSTEPSGLEFELVPSTISPEYADAFQVVHRLGYIKSTGRLFAATYRGLMYSDDHGATWTNALEDGYWEYEDKQWKETSSSSFKNRRCVEVRVTEDGTVFCAFIYNSNSDEYARVFRSTENGEAGSFRAISMSGFFPQFLERRKGRVVIAISPDDPNYVYMTTVSDNAYRFRLEGVFRSTDKGDTWEKIGDYSFPIFAPFSHGSGGSAQGVYDNALAVVKGDKDKIVLGGISLWSWKLGEGWEKESEVFRFNNSPRYVHADVHRLVFHPVTGDLYIACDGGIFRSKNIGVAYDNLNRGLNVTQFYSVGFGPNGDVVGGTQDNSNPYIDYVSGNTVMAAQILNSGDGGFAEISQLDPNKFFVESQYGNLVISANGGKSFSGQGSMFEHKDVESSVTPGEANFAAFVAPFLLWESKNDTMTNDSVVHVLETDLANGETLEVGSNVPTYAMNYTAKTDLSAGDTIKVFDPYQTRFFFGTRQGLFMTRKILDFSGTPPWIQLSDIGGVVSAIAVSADGGTVYYGTEHGEVVRVGNLHQVLEFEDGEDDSETRVTDIQQIAYFPGRFVTGLGLDPNNDGRLVVTLGGYGNHDRVFYSEVANTTSSSETEDNFASIQSDLPGMPVYDALIPKERPDVMLIATDFGVFSSGDNGVSWEPDRNGLPNAPSFMLRQQLFPGTKNYGKIYVATHGRGIFETESLVGMDDDKGVAFGASKAMALKLFPNPAQEELAVSFDSKISGNAVAQIFGLDGKLYQQTDIQLEKGQNSLQLNVSDLSAGTYLVRVGNGASFISQKLLITD